MTSQIQTQMFVPEGAPIVLFSKPVFKTNLNYTVRRGANYAQERGIICGQQIILKETGSETVYGVAQVTHILTCRLKDVPREVLKNEHDPVCENPFCLFNTLLEVYGEIEPDSFVTCIGFVRQ